MATNDNQLSNEYAAAPLFDSHGQAALLLVESLIHGLCEHSRLTVGQAVAIVERAVDVQLERAEAANGAGTAHWQSHMLLSSIAASLRTDDCCAPSPYLASVSTQD